MKKFTLKRVIALVLLGTMLMTTTACKKNENTSSVGSNTGAASSDTQSGDSSVADSSSEGNSSIINSSEASMISSNKPSPGTSTNKPKPGVSSNNPVKPPVVTGTKVFNVEAFGAKGDGKTDDGPAIANAINAAKKDASAKKIVQFKANATYRVINIPRTQTNHRFAINLANSENITVKGNNTKLLLKAPCRFANVEESSNINIEGFVVDYSPKPFVVGKVLAKNRQEKYIDFSCGTNLGFTGTIDAPATYFAFRNRNDERRHYFITKMTNFGNGKYRFYIKNAEQIDVAAVGEEFILPVYGASHEVGGLLQVLSTENFAAKDITIYAAPDFLVGLRRNTGYTNFTNVQIKPDPKDNVKLVSWRDGYHVKDNLSKMTWDNCYIGPIGDDAFNLSSVTCTVDSYNESTRVINMTPGEDGTTRWGLKPGDEIIVYNKKSGKLIGEAKIASVIENSAFVVIRIDRALPIQRGDKVDFYCYNKDYVIKNSYIEGTVRVRSSGTFENCRFNVFWVNVENDGYYWEGPVPKNITFSKCSFTTPYSGNPAIFNVATNTQNYTAGEYKCKNIVLSGCKFIKGKINIQAGNQVIQK